MYSDDHARLPQMEKAKLFLQAADDASRKLQDCSSTSTEPIIAFCSGDADNFYKRVAMQCTEGESTTQPMEKDTGEIASKMLSPEVLEFMAIQSAHEADRIVQEKENDNPETLLDNFMAAFPNTIEHDPAVSAKKEEIATRMIGILHESGISFDADMCGRLCKIDGSSGAKDILRLPTTLQRLQKSAQKALEKLDPLAKGVVFHRAVQFYFLRRNQITGKRKKVQDLSDDQMEEVFILLKLYNASLYERVRTYLKKDPILSVLKNKFFPEYPLQGKNVKEVVKVSLRKRADLLVQTTTTKEPTFLLYDWKFPQGDFSSQSYAKTMHIYMYLVNKEFGVTSSARLVAFHDDGSYNVTEHPITMTENDEETALNTIVETLSNMRSGGKKRKMSVNKTQS